MAHAHAKLSEKKRFGPTGSFNEYLGCVGTHISILKRQMARRPELQANENVQQIQETDVAYINAYMVMNRGYRSLTKKTRFDNMRQRQSSNVSSPHVSPDQIQQCLVKEDPTSVFAQPTNVGQTSDSSPQINTEAQAQSPQSSRQTPNTISVLQKKFGVSKDVSFIPQKMVRDDSCLPPLRQTTKHGQKWTKVDARAAELIRDVYGLCVSPGTLVSRVGEAKVALQGTADLIAEHLRNAPLLNAGAIRKRTRRTTSVGAPNSPLHSICCGASGSMPTPCCSSSVTLRSR